MFASWSLDDLAPAMLCGNLVATCTQDIGVRGYGYIHGYPRKNPWIWIWIWMENFISTVSLPSLDSAHPKWDGGPPKKF